MDVFFLALGITFLFLSAVIIFGDNSEMSNRDAYLSGALFAFVAIVALVITFSLHMFENKVVTITRIDDVSEIDVSREANDDGTVTRTTKKNWECGVTVIENYRLLVMVGEEAKFYFENACDDLSESDIGELNTFLEQVSPDVRVQSLER